MTYEDKQALIEWCEWRIAHGSKKAMSEQTLKAAKITLAALTAPQPEPVGKVVLGDYDDCGMHPDAKVICLHDHAGWENFADGTELYTAPPAPVMQLVDWKQRAEAAELLAAEVTLKCIAYRNANMENLKRAEAAETKLQAITESRDQWEANAHEFSRCADRLEAKLAELEAGPKFIANIKSMSELAESQGLVEKLGNSCNHQWIRSEGRTASGWICNKCGDYEGPAPAINLAELVPREVPKEVYRVIYQQCGGFVDSDANAQTIWTCCRATILRNIEEANN